jgi:hypothetical protein
VSAQGWWELAVVAEKLGFSRRDHLLALVERLISRGILNTSEFSRERGRIPGTRGQPRKLVFLAPSAVVAVSAHAATSEAAAFRNQALARLAEMPSNALPAPVEHNEITELRLRLDGLERHVRVVAENNATFLRERVAEIEQRAQSATARLEERVEKLEARVGEQFALPMAMPELPQVPRDIGPQARARAVVEALRSLMESVPTNRRRPGLTTNEILGLLVVGDPRAEPLRLAIADIGYGVKHTPQGMGVFLRWVRAESGLALDSQSSGKGSTRWFVSSDLTH